jgi:serine/threonine-protein kinase
VSAGATFGPYRVVRQIGAGGMGAVYLGEHTLIGRHAAIKVLLPELSAQRKNVDRFFHEARATSIVSDPGIVQIYDFGFTAEQIAFIVMEFLDGESVAARLHRLVTLTPAEALRITRQVASSLAAAHAAGIVHRDLKPDNLFLVRDPEAPGGERAKILDFGIAKLGDDDPANRGITKTGQVIGTPVFMSPEQAAGHTVDFRADIYSLGCVLFQMLTGRPVFDLPSMYAIISAHLRDEPPLVTQIAPHLPPELDPIIARCLAKRPSDRFGSMSELQAACDALLASAVPTLQRAHTAQPKPSFAHTTLGSSTGQSLARARSFASPRRRIVWWLAGGALAIGAGVGLAVITASGGPHIIEPAQAARSVTMPVQPPPTLPPAPPPIAAPTPAIDAGVATPAVAPKPTAPHRATVKPKPSSSDLYEDRGGG